MLEHSAARGLEELATLSDPVRRRLYLYVLGQADAVSRDAAAAAGGVTRSLAAFHLDRLVEAGLLNTEYRRLSGRSGPGAGRPSKLYRPSAREVHATLPERRYEVAAALFAAALSAPNAGPEALQEVARAYGEGLGRESAPSSVPSTAEASAEPGPVTLESLLRDAGYVPFERDGEIRLLNCPFHALAQDHRELTCGMNLALLQGLVAGARFPASVRLDPVPGLCCVAIEPKTLEAASPGAEP